MGIWAGIKYALNSTLGTTGFKSLDKLINEYITTAKNSIMAGGGIKCIKSIQTGTYTSTGSQTVTISAVNVNKSIVLVHGSGYDTYSSHMFAVLPLGYLSSSTKLSLGCGSSNGNPEKMGARWFVIEFY